MMGRTWKRLALCLVCGAIVAAILVWSFYTGRLRFNYPSRARYPIHGLDISHHQGDIDWDLLKQQNIQFIYMKATEGGDWVDPKFKRFWDAAMEREIVVGGYHFYRLCKTGIEQADNFIATVPKSEKSLPHAVDLESLEQCATPKPKEQLLEEIGDYLSMIHRHYGKAPIIYASDEFYRRYLIHRFKATPIWIRGIYFKPRLPDRRPWTIWQYSNRGSISGIRGPVDLNAFSGSEAQFAAFIQSME